MASMRANQIAQQILAAGELRPSGQLGRGAKPLAAGFRNVFRSANFTVA
jgi:hypothetical protein